MDKATRANEILKQIAGLANEALKLTGAPIAKGSATDGKSIMNTAVADTAVAETADRMAQMKIEKPQKFF